MRIDSASDENFEEIIQSNEKVLVKFYASWCGICKAFSPEFERMVQEDKYREFKVIEIEAPENPKARLAAGVYSLPFFASFYQGKQFDKCPSADKKLVAELMDDLASLKSESVASM